METKLSEGVVTIMRGHLGFFSSDIPEDDLRRIATKLCQMIQTGESEMALNHFVHAQLGKLMVAPIPYKDIVADVTALVKNSPTHPC
jgi:hypothetical protein